LVWSRRRRFAATSNSKRPVGESLFVSHLPDERASTCNAAAA
jgi:hypothetical protein